MFVIVCNKFPTQKACANEVMSKTQNMRPRYLLEFGMVLLDEDEIFAGRNNGKYSNHHIEMHRQTIGQNPKATIFHFNVHCKIKFLERISN